MDNNSYISINKTQEENSNLKLPNNKTPKSNEKEIYNNIGKNITINICNKKKIIGTFETFYLFIVTILVITISYIFCILTMNMFYSFYVYLIGGILYFFTIYYMISCFLIEPGIIPRNHPDFQNNIINEKNINEENTNNEIKIKIENKNENKIEEIENINEYNKKNEYEKENENIIPSILTYRKCESCNIIRPPKSTHCKFCDNCVLNFDHHCIYVSNCIGFRNHRHFYLFVLIGTIFTTYVTICNFIHVIYILFFTKYPIWTLMYEGNGALLILSLCLLSISIYQLSSCTHQYKRMFIPFIFGISIIIYLFYTNVKNVPIYITPFSILSLINVVILNVFVGNNLYEQTIQIMNGLTIKQSFSINKEYCHNSIKRKTNFVYSLYFPKLTYNSKFENLKKFFFVNREQSYVNN